MKTYRVNRMPLCTADEPSVQRKCVLFVEDEPDTKKHPAYACRYKKNGNECYAPVEKDV